MFYKIPFYHYPFFALVSSNNKKTKTLNNNEDIKE